MEDLEGRVEAYDLGSRKDLHNEFVTLESEEVVEKELADLKAKMAATRSNASE